mmetsp:Transcript_112155/g.323996  ORF Transcript_112155/g.323996 Transcript_112155/m.323996 type:complete len:352 (+) Transcript_112155:975-2030(+)
MPSCWWLPTMRYKQMRMLCRLRQVVVLTPPSVRRPERARKFQVLWRIPCGGDPVGSDRAHQHASGVAGLDRAVGQLEHVAHPPQRFAAGDVVYLRLVARPWDRCDLAHRRYRASTTRHAPPDRHQRLVPPTTAGILRPALLESVVAPQSYFTYVEQVIPRHNNAGGEAIKVDGDITGGAYFDHHTLDPLRQPLAARAQLAGNDHDPAATRWRLTPSSHRPCGVKALLCRNARHGDLLAQKVLRDNWQCSFDQRSKQFASTRCEGEEEVLRVTVAGRLALADLDKRKCRLRKVPRLEEVKMVEIAQEGLRRIAHALQQPQVPAASDEFREECSEKSERFHDIQPQNFRGRSQ